MKKTVNSISAHVCKKKSQPDSDQTANLLQFLAHHHPLWVWQVDENKNFTYNNGIVTQMLGYRPEALINTSILSLAANRQATLLNDTINNCIHEQSAFLQVPLTMPSAGSKKIQVEISGQAICNKAGKVTGVLGITANLRPKQANEQRLLRNMHLAAEKERLRLANEIHDGIGPLLSGIQLYLATVTSGTLSREKEMELLQNVKHLVTGVTTELRNIANNLMPAEFVNRTLVENVSVLASRLSASAGIQCKVTSTDFTVVFNPETALIVYRIIAELLNNTIKHSKATQISIIFSNSGNTVVVDYADNGLGFAQQHGQKPSCFGLASIKTRLKSIGAAFRYDSQPGEGMKMVFSFENHGPQAENKKNDVAAM